MNIRKKKLIFANIKLFKPINNLNSQTSLTRYYNIISVILYSPSLHFQLIIITSYSSFRKIINYVIKLFSHFIYLLFRQIINIILARFISSYILKEVTSINVAFQNRIIYLLFFVKFYKIIFLFQLRTQKIFLLIFYLNGWIFYLLNRLI